MTARVKQIDVALGRYYQSLGKEYDELFVRYCDDNGLGIIYDTNIEFHAYSKYEYVF